MNGQFDFFGKGAHFLEQLLSVLASLAGLSTRHDNERGAFGEHDYFNVPRHVVAKMLSYSLRISLWNHSHRFSSPSKTVFHFHTPARSSGGTAGGRTAPSTIAPCTAAPTAHFII